jgi:hypothetical protein
MNNTTLGGSLALAPISDVVHRFERRGAGARAAARGMQAPG